MNFREATPEDAATLGALFADAVRSAGPRAYSPAQVEAWASAAADREAFGRRVLTDRTFVAEDDTGPAGFATLGADGHVGALYVRGDRQRGGVGRALLQAVLRTAQERGVTRLHAEASAFALPLFEQAGFVVVGTETVERGGVAFRRHLVERIATA